jgi:hypothetical protein
MPIWISIILLIVQYGPSIWKMVQEIIDLINGVSEYLPRSEGRIFKVTKRQELKDAVAYYRLTKDKIKLESMHGELTCQLSNFRNR